MSAPRNIVALTAASGESRQKALSWTRAAHALGLEVRSRPDRGTVAIVPCSDSKLRDAAWLCRTHGVPGSDPAAAAVLASKALAYDFLRAQGFEVLFSYVPLSAADLGIGFDRPLIVKPEYGSGTHAMHEWGYKVFDGVRDLRRWLARRGLTRRFFDYQANPHPQAGRYLAMEFVPSQWIHAVQCILGDGELGVFDHFSCTLRPNTMTVETVVLGERLPGAAAIVAMARAFARLGVRRSMLIVQCVERDGKLFPIDFNVRIGALFDRLNRNRRLGFYEQALRFMLGDSARMEFAWPAPRVGIHRLYLPLRAGRWRASFGPGSIPLVKEVSYDVRKPYDFGYAWPGFAVLAADRGDALSRIRSVLAQTTVRRVA